MADDRVPILGMAVLVAIFVIGFALTPFTALPLVVCLRIAAIGPTTDPSAVVSTFRNLSAPQRLTRVVEGEGLLNDAAAVALLGFFLTFVVLTERLVVDRPGPGLARGGLVRSSLCYF